MNLGGMDIFDSPLPGEAHAQVKKAVLAGDLPQGNARCARLTCRETGCNSVCEHRLWTSCVPGRFFAEPPAKPRSTQVFKMRGHGGGGCLCILKSNGGVHIAQRRKPGFWASHICLHPSTPPPAHTRPHPPTPPLAHTHPHLPTPTPAHTSICSHSPTPAHISTGTQSSDRMPALYMEASALDSGFLSPYTRPARWMAVTGMPLERPQRSF